MLHFMYVSCSDFRSGFNGLFDISYNWNGLGGALVTVLLTIIFSLILGNYNLMKNEYYVGSNKG